MPIDDPWTLSQLPPVAPRVLWVLSRQHYAYLTGYNNQADSLVAMGFEFADVFGDGVGSVASLTAESYPHPGPPDGVITTWLEADTGGLLPVAVEPRHQVEGFQFYLAGFYFLFDPDDIDTYPPALVSVAALVQAHWRFYWGITVRVCWGMAQIKCAACLANVLGLDNRGRPIGS